MGLQAYLRFYESSQGGQKKTYGDFVNSQYYNAFVKFGKHIIDIKAINPSAFIDYVLKNNIKLDKFCKDENYQNYLEQHLRIESEKKVTPPKPKPKPQTTRKYYTVRSGDTFGHIAERHRMSQSRLRKLNPRININRLDIGQKIRIR